MARAQAELAAASLGFPFQIVRSPRRKRVAIEVRQGQVSLRAPPGVAEAYLLAFLKQKAAWVRAKIAEQQQHQQSLPAEPEYEAGSQLPFLGSSLTLVLASGASAAIARRDQELHLILSSRSRKPRQVQIKELLARWYQQQALAILKLKTQQLSAAMGLKFSQVSVKATRSKWGHCTSAGAIQYNWHILLAPEAVVDYLVAHEVSHLRHHNHSPAFWALVASVCPNYLALRRWLKAQGNRLVL